jgi:CubicO group peptidase (beta-lactamase class C family)
MLRHRRGIAAAAISIVALAAGCTSSTSSDTTETSSVPTSSDLAPNQVAGVALPENTVDNAVGKLDGIVDELMKNSGIPGMAVAVVHGGKTVYAKGFGVREVGKSDKIDADTVFQLASLSKSLAATVVAHEVGAKSVTWDTPVASKLPGFALRDPYVTQNVTIGDMFAHRSGLPEHAGDQLEDLGYNRTQVLDKLRMDPLDPFRITYHYTNFGITAAAEAAAKAAGTDWEKLSADAVYTPLGMGSTSSRFDDYKSRPDRAVGHMLVDGKYVAKAVRDADAQSPAGGASSSVNDMARWLTMMLGNGTYDGKQIAPPDALLPAVTPQVIANPAGSPDARAGFYGYGFNVSTTPAGRVTYSHSGAFALGAGTNFLVIPSADVAIIALTNAAPIGIPETLTAEFADLVQYGQVREDWRGLYKQAFASMDKPVGSLVGQKPPAAPAPAGPPTAYAGTYNNDYGGPATISVKDGGLVLGIGPAGQTYSLKHWDGDTFTFELSNENAPPGTVSKATFAGDTLTLEYFDSDGIGRFTR